jgi:hypothetical protein
MLDEDTCVVAFEYALHGAETADAVEESWADNRLMRALALDRPSCRKIAEGIVESASGRGEAISDKTGASRVAVRGSRVLGFHFSYSISPHMSVPDEQFEGAMACLGHPLRAYGIFRRAVDLLCRAQADAVSSCLGINSHTPFTRMIGGVRPGVPRGTYQAMANDTWNTVFSSVVKGGPAVIMYAVNSHPATIRYAVRSHNNSVICPALGCARRLNFRVDRGLSANAAAASAAEAAAEEAAKAAECDLDSLSRWKLQVIPTPHGFVYRYILCIRIDVSRTFGVLHDGFAVWPDSSTCPAIAPILIVTITCTTPPPRADARGCQPVCARL